MSELPGVYTTRLKDGTASYRAGITVKSKHISLGSFDNPDDASGAYRDALYTLKSDCTIEDYEKNPPIFLLKNMSSLLISGTTAYILIRRFICTKNISCIMWTERQSLLLTLMTFFIFRINQL